MRKLMKGILLISSFVIFGFSTKGEISIEAQSTTEAMTTTSEVETTSIIEVEKIKIKCKKTMTAGSKQKIKVLKVIPENATCKKIKIINRTKKILSVKKKTIKAKKEGLGIITVKSKDGALSKDIEIKVVAPKNTFKGVTLQYSKRYKVTSNPLNQRMGVKYYNGLRETYYSQRVLPGGGLKIPGRHVAEDGTIRDGEGYIVVACNAATYKKGTKIMISLGPAKVYDSCPSAGVIDTYVNW